MSMLNVIQLIQSFNESPFTVEQAERLTALRQATSSYAAVIYQGLPEGPWRELALQQLQLSFLASRQAIAIEAAPPGVDSGAERRELLKLAAESLNKRQTATLGALLGLHPDDVENCRPPRKRS